MESKWLEIELRSELCAATGDGGSGGIDTEIAHVHGLPIIPAKRLKGCLLEVAKELQDWGLATGEEVAKLFGAPGQENSGALQVYDAHVYRIPIDLLGKGDFPKEIEIKDFEALVGQLARARDCLLYTSKDRADEPKAFCPSGSQQ